MPTPLNLETIVTPSVIANLGLIQLNTTKDATDTSFCKCGLCHSGVMYIYPDVETGGSRFYCNNCYWAGTTIQLYQELRNIPNINTAWQLLSSEAELVLPKDAVLEALDYYNNYRYRLDILNICRSKWKWHLTKNIPTAFVQFLEKNGLWVGDTTFNSNAGIGKYVGCLTWSNYIDLLKTSYVIGPFKHKQFKYKDAVVIEYETVPGQLSAVLLIDRYGRREFRSTIQNRRQVGVLGISETVDYNGEDVIVVDDPLLYLELVQKWVTFSNQKSGIICIPDLENTEGSVSLTYSLNSNKKFICLGKGDIANNLNLARNFESVGKHYHLVNPSDVSNKNIVSLLNGIKQNAVSWPEAFKNVSKISTPQEFALITKNKLTKQEIELIRDTCTREEWLEIEHHFSDVSTVDTFEIDGVIYVYRPNKGLYKLNKIFKPNTPQEQLICDVYVEFKNMAYVNDTTYISGVIKGNSYEIAFTEDLSDIKHKFDEWLVNKTVREGSIIHITNKYRKQLFDVFFKRSNVQIVKTLNKVGWSPEAMGWQFVKFEITEDGNYRVHNKYAELKTPLTKLIPTKPSKLLFDKWFKNTTTNAFVVNLVKTLIVNLLISKDGGKPYSVAILHADDNTYNVLQEFGEALNLNKYAQRTNPKQTHLDKLSNSEKQHAVPVVVHKESFLHPVWLNWLRYSSPHNVITTTNTKELVNLDTVTNWLVFNGAGVVSDNFTTEFSEVGELVPYVLAYIVKNNKEKPANLTYFEFINTCVISCLANAGIDVEFVTKMHDSYVRTLPKDAWSKFVFQLICAEQLNELNVTKSNNDVVLNWKILSAKLNKLGYDVVTLESLENTSNDIRKVDGGWVLPANTFEAYRKLFKLITFAAH